MPNQVALTVVAPLRAGARSQLDRALAAAAAGGEAAVPFAELTGVHFARVFVLAADVAADGTPTAEKLVWMSDVDAPLERHLAELADRAGPALDRLFCHCRAYPEQVDAAGRRGYLQAHTVTAAAAYVNTVGRGLDQVLLERRLRDAIERFLDEQQGRLAGCDSLAVREQIRRFVDADQALRPALPAAGGAVRRVPRPRGRPPGAGAGAAGAAAAADPARAAGVRGAAAHPRAARRARPAAARRRPRRGAGGARGPLDPEPVHRRRVDQARAVSAADDMGVLWIADYFVRHIFNRANLAGVKTIHFARWVFLDGRRRVVFASSYDGSVESYMDDFIDKVWWGLNAVFSNGVGYPRTRWLVFGGARDERAFKRVLRRRQEPVQLWYSAYPDLTAVNLQNNQRLRAGLAGSMDERAGERLAGAAVSGRERLELDDMQGLILRGYGDLPAASLLLTGSSGRPPPAAGWPGWRRG